MTAQNKSEPSARSGGAESDDRCADLSPEPLRDIQDMRPVRTPVQLLRRWRGLMGPHGFDAPQLWAITFDPDGYQQPACVEINPLEPLPDGIGVEEFVNRLAGGIVLALPRGHTVAFLRGRPGEPAMHPDDLRWASALLSASADAELGDWPVHLGTRDRVRPVTADDLGLGSRPA